MSSAKIRQLPGHSVEAIRSDCVITSIAQAVDELVSNSIDAGATEIKASTAILSDLPIPLVMKKSICYNIISRKVHITTNVRQLVILALIMICCRWTSNDPC